MFFFPWCNSVRSLTHSVIASKPKKVAKKARTSSPSGGDSDAFVVPDDEDDDDMYWDNVEDVDLDALEESIKTKSTPKPKAKVYFISLISEGSMYL